MSKIIRLILSKINEKSTVSALSRTLEMREQTVQSIVEAMVHQGYLEEIRCKSGCSLCSMKCDLSSPKFKIYSVTLKGRKYLISSHAKA
mgnify:CR=1 FL=1